MQAPLELGAIVEYLAAILGTASLSWALTPAMRRLALRRAVLDSPDGARKVQKAPVPYLGGLAIAAATTLALLGASAIRGYPADDLPLLLGVLVPALMLALVGLLDDLRGLTPAPRFLAQTAAAIVTTGFLVSAGTGAQLSAFGVVNFALTLVWIVGVTNSLNLIDNMDGAASGTAAIAALAFFFMALLNGQYLVAGLAAVLAGTCLGFLWWNRHPASIYMGDSGSLFIGFLLAAIAIRIDLRDALPTVALLAPALVLALPVLDTSLVVVSRIRRGVSPFTGGLDHLSHRIRRTGRSVKQTVRLIWGGAAVAGLVALLISRAGFAVGVLLATTSAVAFTCALWCALRLPESDGHGVDKR